LPEAKRKSILVDEAVHQRFNGFWKKTQGRMDMMITKNNTNVLNHLMDFYEQHATSEIIEAMEFIKKVRKE
jgi:hypothetical protein